jgi:hypothetical protein
MTAHFLKRSTMASNLQPPVDEDDTVSVPISHNPILEHKKI